MTQASPTPHGTILVVDDAPDILAFLDLKLTKEGYRVVTVEDGQDALDIIDEAEPDLIISDVLMPRLSGFDLLFQLRGMTKYRSIPFIFLTSRTEAPDKAIALGMGADYYVDKPLKWPVLKNHVQKIFGLKKKIQTFERENIKGFRGNLKDMPVHEVLQLLEMGLKTGVLSIKSRKGEAIVELLRGQPMKAKIDAFEDLSIEQTLLEALSWKEGAFSFQPSEVKEPSNPRIRLSNVLLRWSVQADHDERDRAISDEVQDSLEFETKRKIKVKIPDGSPIAQHLDAFRFFLNEAVEVRLVGVVERDRISWVSAESEKEERRYVEKCLEWVRAGRRDNFSEFPEEVFRVEISGSLGRVVFRPIPAREPLLLVLLYPKKNPPYNVEVKDLIEYISNVYEQRHS